MNNVIIMKLKSSLRNEIKQVTKGQLRLILNCTIVEMSFE